MRRAVPRRIHHRIQFDRIHTFEHRPSQTSPALLRRNAAWIAVGRRLGLPIERGFSIDGCNVCTGISPSFSRSRLLLDCHQDALLHFRLWPGISPTKAPRGSRFGTGLPLKAWHGFRFRRTAASRISRVPSWRPHDSLRSSRGRAPERSRSIRIHRNAAASRGAARHPVFRSAAGQRHPENMILPKKLTNQ